MLDEFVRVRERIAGNILVSVDPQLGLLLCKVFSVPARLLFPLAGKSSGSGTKALELKDPSPYSSTESALATSLSPLYSITDGLCQVLSTYFKASSGRHLGGTGGAHSGPSSAFEIDGK
jgi:hypothetical protein